MKTSTDYAKEYAARVKAARKDSGLTQEKLASLLDIDRGNYKQYETRSKLPQEYVDKFCEITGADPGWLVTGKDPQDGLTSQQRRWLVLMEHSSEKKRKILEGLARNIGDNPDSF